MFFLFGCSSTKHLKKNEYLLYRNGLKGAPKEDYSAMTDLYKQRNNRKILGMLPYVNLYNFGKIFLDTSKVIRKKNKIIVKYDEKIKSAKSEKIRSKRINKKEKKIKHKDLVLSDGNAFMRSLGEPPEIFDSLKVDATIVSMKAYLFSKGYFHNTVSAEIDTAYRRKRVSVRYFVDEGVPFIIDTVIYKVDDLRIDSLLNKPSLHTKLIREDDKYDEDKINTERENIYKLLKDHGYFNFQRQDISFEVDSLRNPYRLDITVFVKKQHHVYRLSKLYFNMNDAGDRTNLKPDTFLYKRVYYTYYKKTYLRKLLDYKITIRPYDIYSQSKFQRTQRLLGSMDMYKFVNVNIVENKDTAGYTLTGFINTQPLNKFQLSQEYGLSVGQALIPGPFLSVTLKTRNIFRWLEVIEHTFRYSFEAQYTTASNSEPYRAREFSAFTSINLSQLLFPSPLRGLVKNYYPRVRFYTGYTFITRPEYRRESFKSGLTYSYTRNAYSNFFITPIEVTYIDSKVDPAYNSFLQELRNTTGSNLYLSFNPSIVTDFQFSYVYNNHELNSRKVTKFFRPSFEFGGIVPTLIANKYASSEDRDSSRLFGKQIFEFIRLGLDVRYYFPVQKTNSFVVRLNMGYAQPFGESSRSDLYALPYEKYFFSGGNSSIRAWKPRRLGPGSYSGNSQNGYLYEQPGEILFETNAEYRFKMVGIFNGALFVDAGNVWTIKDDKPGSQFKLASAISDLAVGAGVGLRLDFSFLVIRLDLAHRVLDPALPAGDKLVDKFRTSQIVYNIGIGYPF